MKISDLTKAENFTTIVPPVEDRAIESVFCCDLLSLVMGRAPADGAWVTVMGNMNAVAVASLADSACIILAEGVQMDADGLAKAKSQGIALFTTKLPVFAAALQIHNAL